MACTNPEKGMKSNMVDLAKSSSSVIYRVHTRLTVTRLSAMWKISGFNITARSCIYHNSHCDKQPWTSVA